MLAARSYGIPREPLILFFATLQDVQYHTRTMYGVSAETFGGLHANFTNKPQGAGQGNGAAPQLWAIVSSKMFEMLHTLGLASTIIRPISGIDMAIVGFAYVDNSDLIAYSRTHNVQQTVQKMQKVVNAWEKAAKVTGGAIAPLKCWWYLVFFEWDAENNWFYGDNNKYKLTALDASDKCHELTYLKPHQAQEMLGVHIAPDGNNTDQVETLIKKATDYGQRMQTNHTYSHEAWIGMTQVVMKSLDYCLPATTMSQQQCDKIMWQVIKCFLPKSGINRFIKRDVLYSPASLQGLGLKNLYLMQGIHHVTDLIENVWKDSITGHFQMTSLEFLRLELGINCHLLNSDYDKFSALIITPSWIVNTWQFMSKHNITVDIDPPQFDQVRENDSPLMELILNTASISSKEAAIANKCRIYLQVFMVSDLVTGCGKFLKDNVWNGIRDNHNKPSNIEWPLFPRPSPSMLKTWQSVLRRVLCTAKYKVLDRPLQRWLKTPEHWTWYLDGDQLISKDYKQVVRVHAIVGGTPRRCRYNKKGKRSCHALSPSAIPTTVKHNAEYYEAEGTSRINRRPSLKDPNLSYRHWLHVNETTHKDDQVLCNSILQGSAHAICDGSYFEHEKVGAAAWVLTDAEYQVVREGQTIVPGKGDIHSSFRSELTGILAILQKLQDVCQDHSLDSGQITIHCDNKSALKVISQWQLAKVNPRKKNADIISACIKLRDKLPITITCQHVYAHQDTNVRVQELAPDAQWNVYVDKKAKILAELLIKGHYRQTDDSTHPLSFARCQYKGRYILHKLSDGLYEEISKTKMISYWIEKERLTEHTQDAIDMEAMKKSHNAMTFTHKRFTAKWACEFVATGKNMKRWKQRLNGNCPYCMSENEDTHHIMTCTHADAKRNWEDALQQWVKLLRKIDTCSHLTGAVWKELQAWRNDDSLPCIETLPSLLQVAIREQREIGWKQFLEGMVGQSWKRYMSRYYLGKHSKRSGNTWASRLVTYNWRTVFKVWEFRNEQLHHTERIRDLEGMPKVVNAIRMEWAIGIGRLPASQFSHYFNLPLEQLLKKNHDYLKTWLMIIRQGRILLDPSNLCQDDIKESEVLQKWLDISYVISDEEAMGPLKEVILDEWNIGKGNLPLQFHKYFLGSVKNLLKKEVNVLRKWLKDIRQGRIKFDNGNLLLDEFTSPGALKSWLEL